MAIKQEFQDLKNKLKLAKTKKTIKVIKKMALRKLRAILKDNYITRDTKQEATKYYKEMFK